MSAPENLEQSEPTSPIEARRISSGLMFRLACADLIHERMLTACVVLALTAVAAPLLIMFGLKHGVITTLRERLVNDPRNRELRPVVSATYSQEWFSQLKARPDVAFAIPMTRQISATVTVRVRGSSEREQADISPTAPEDRLLLENGGVIPQKGECVLSETLARRIGASVGDSVVITASRQRGIKAELGEVNLQVAGIVTARATSESVVYVELPLLEAVESYKDGQAVPSLGWQGDSPEPPPLYDGVLLGFKEPLPRDRELSLVINTGFSEVSRLDAFQVKELGVPSETAESLHHYLLTTLDTPAPQSAIAGLKRTAAREAKYVIPWTKPIEVQILDTEKRPIMSKVSVQPLAEISTENAGEARTAADTVNRATSSESPKKAEEERRSEATPELEISAEGTGSQPANSKGSMEGAVKEKAPLEAASDPYDVRLEWSAPQSKPKPAPSVRSDQEAPPRTPLLPPRKRANPPTETPKRAVPGKRNLPDLKGSDRSSASLKVRAIIMLGSIVPIRETDSVTSPSQQQQGLADDTSQVREAGSQAKGTSELLPAQPTQPVPLTIRALVPEHLKIPIGQQFQVSLKTPNSDLTFVAVAAGTVPAGQKGILFPGNTAGILRLAHERSVGFNSEARRFELVRRGYAGFRLYATTIDDVEGLVSYFRQQGLDLFTQAARIRDVKELDRYTTMIFSSIALVGLSGAIAALLASLYAAVERKRRELSVLRLLGIQTATLCRVPVYQAGIIISLSVLLAIGIFSGVSSVLNGFSQRYLDAGEKICQIPSLLILWGWVASVVLAGVASLAAAMRITAIEPSEALRDE